jgi:hypothetical protein
MPGTSSKNPLDLAAQFFFREVVHEIIDIALSDKKIDGLILDMPSFYLAPLSRLTKRNSFESSIIESLCLGHKHKKPLIPIIQRSIHPDYRESIIKKLTEKKVPVFGDPLEFIPLLPKISQYTKRLKNS